MTDQPGTTLMAEETRETTDAVARFFDKEESTLRALGGKLRALATR